jgi:poly-gamma-glutamate synthesis protein (capsule biosynthesis protein)
VFVGDVMLGRGVAQALEGGWEDAFAAVRPWLSGEAWHAERGPTLTLANLESPLTRAPHLGEGQDLAAPPEAVAALRSGGIDAVSLANNHAMDAGQRGMRETVKVLRRADIMPCRGQATARAPRTIPTLLVADPLAVYGLAVDDSLRPLDLPAAATAVGAAARQADVVIVSIHWGGEYQAAPSRRQREIARVLAEAGARVIVGHGPHVLQRVEWVGETLVAYSLGNFSFDQLYPVDCRWGAILRVELQGGEIATVEALPTLTGRGRVEPADPETRDAILVRLGLDDSVGRQEGTR